MAVGDNDPASRSAASFPTPNVFLGPRPMAEPTTKGKQRKTNKNKTRTPTKETNEARLTIDNCQRTFNKRISIRVCFPCSWRGRSGRAEGKTRDGTVRLVGKGAGALLCWVLVVLFVVSMVGIYFYIYVYRFIYRYIHVHTYIVSRSHLGSSSKATHTSPICEHESSTRQWPIFQLNIASPCLWWLSVGAIFWEFDLG